MVDAELLFDVLVQLQDGLMVVREIERLPRVDLLPQGLREPPPDVHLRLLVQSVVQDPPESRHAVGVVLASGQDSRQPEQFEEVAALCVKLI